MAIHTEREEITSSIELNFGDEWNGIVSPEASGGAVAVSGAGVVVTGDAVGFSMFS